MKKLITSLALTLGISLPAYAQTVHTNPFGGTVNAFPMRADSGTTTTTNGSGTTVSSDISALFNAPYGVPQLNGHAAVTSPIVGPVDSATVNGQTLSTLIATMAAQNTQNKWIPLSSYGAASGTPQLDAYGHLANPGLNLYTTYTRADNTTVSVPIMYFGASQLAQQYYSLSPESQVMGGFIGSTTASGQTISYPSYASMTILGRPSGPYNAGCVMCVFATDGTYSNVDGQAQISGQDYRTGAAAIANIDGAQSTSYQKDKNYSARVVTPVTSFTATTAVLATPLTQEQVALIHQGMYVATNVISPTAPATGPTGLISENTYWGIVQSVTSTTITVYGWAVLGQGVSDVGQIPNATYLDKTKSGYTTPVLFIGAPAKLTSSTTDIDFDGSRVYGATATARANDYTREITNFNASNFTKQDSVRYHGWTTNFNCLACDVNAVNKDSYGFYINAPGLPKAYVAHLYGTGVEYQGDSTYLPSNGAPSSTQGSNHIVYDFVSDLPMGTEKHLSARVYHDITGDTVADNYAIRIGTTLGGTRTNDVFSGGQDLGFLTFGGHGHPSNICFETATQQPTLCSDINGNISVTNTLSVNILNSSAYAIGSANYNATSDQFTGQGAILRANDTGNSEMDTYAVRQNAGATSGIRWGVVTAGSGMSSVNTLASLTSQASTTYVPISQISQTASTVSGIQQYASGGFTSSIFGRSGGAATGNYSVSLKMQESVNKWTGAVLSLNSYTGPVSWRFSDDGTIVFPDGTVFNGHIPDVSPATYMTVATAQTVTGAKIICSTQTCVDPNPGIPRDLKLEGTGLAVSGGARIDNLAVTGAITEGNFNISTPTGRSPTLSWADQFHQMTIGGTYSYNTTSSTITASSEPNVMSFLNWSDNGSSASNSYKFQFYSAQAVTTPLMITRDQIVVNTQLFISAQGSLALSNFKVDTITPATSDHITTTAPIVPQVYTHATLPATFPQWGEAVCTDCRSYLTASNYSVKGIRVMFNGTDWVDLVGNKLPPS